MSELIGYDNEIQSFLNNYKSKSLHSSIIIHGPKGIGKRLFISTIIAFIVFFINDVIAALGQGSNSSEILSAWAPKLAPMIISSSIILYLEDS